MNEVTPIDAKKEVYVKRGPMKAIAMPNCCSAAIVTNEEAATANPKNKRYITSEGSAEAKQDLYNISSFSNSYYTSVETQIEQALADVKGLSSNYSTGIMCQINKTQGGYAAALKKAGFIPLVDWPGGHGGTCTLYFKYRPNTEHNPAKAKLYSQPENPPEWLEGPKVQADSSVSK